VHKFESLLASVQELILEILHGDTRVQCIQHATLIINRISGEPVELSSLLDVFYGLLELEEEISYPKHFYKCEPREAFILDEIANIIIKNIPVVGWTLIKGKQLSKLNLGSLENLKMVFISYVLPFHFEKGIKTLLQHYKDVFAWSYEEIKGIPC
jgi:hypothetical protein